MFLDVLSRRNPKLIEATIYLHQQGKIPANSYVIDLDTVSENATLFKNEADKLGLKTFAMTKQVGRNSGFCEALKTAGINKVVAVDMTGAAAAKRAGMEIGHLGHLVQVPRFEATGAAKYLKPDYWTVFNMVKAGEAAKAAQEAGYTQNLLARIQAEGDIFYRGHEGGFPAERIVDTAHEIEALTSAKFAGITTFPALLFDEENGEVIPTQNLATLANAAEALGKAGFKNLEVNAPGTTSVVTLKALANAGATQCEPGNALHGTTPLHAIKDLPERPAVLYLSEVSHEHQSCAYCFGGGLYIDPVFPEYDVRAIISPDPENALAKLASVEIPPPSAIDYYGMIDTTGPVKPQPGDSVIFGFRGQAFVTRAHIVGVRGISSGTPIVQSIENGFGDKIIWPL